MCAFRDHGCSAVCHQGPAHGGRGAHGAQEWFFKKLPSPFRSVRPAACPRRARATPCARVLASTGRCHRFARPFRGAGGATSLCCQCAPPMANGESTAPVTVAVSLSLSVRCAPGRRPVSKGIVLVLSSYCLHLRVLFVLHMPAVQRMFLWKCSVC